jgi:hypothetical protein
VPSGYLADLNFFGTGHLWVAHLRPHLLYESNVLYTAITYLRAPGNDQIGARPGPPTSVLDTMAQHSAIVALALAVAVITASPCAAAGRSMLQAAAPAAPAPAAGGAPTANVGAAIADLVTGIAEAAAPLINATVASLNATAAGPANATDAAAPQPLPALNATVLNQTLGAVTQVSEGPKHRRLACCLGFMLAIEGNACCIPH